jgi:putative ABC transport system permease protein
MAGPIVFWRLVFQLLRGNRGRLTVAILALVSGAAVISGLLNLELGVEYQLTQQFRTLGANIVIAPKPAESAPESALGSSALMNEQAVLVPVQRIAGRQVSFAPFAYLIARADRTQVVAVGTWLDQIHELDPTWKVEGNWIGSRDDQTLCLAGRNAAKQLHLVSGSRLQLQYLSRAAECSVAGIFDSGTADDNQVFLNLRGLQALAGLPGEISLVQLNVSGGSKWIASIASQLSEALPQFEVRPIREVTEAEGMLLGRIRLLIVSMVILILVLTALCVLATMAALAIERRADIGLMKALGGSISRIVGFFVAEVGLLGAAGGLIGAMLGVALSYWMGLRVFDAPISPRWEVFPLTVFLMTTVAMAGVLPLRMLGEVKPAIMLRGE